MLSKVVLSPFVLSRVHNPEVERLLASMALEVGKPEIANNLVRRREMREAAAKRKPL